MRLARKASGLSQRGLAERLRTDVQTIKRMEKGVGSVATLTAAMSALDFRINGLGPGSTLHERLRSRRLRRSMSQEEAAARANITRGTVAELEAGGGSIASLLKLLAAVAPKARRRAQERSYWGEGDKADRDSRFTPPDFLEQIRAAFGEIDIDPCGHELSPVAARRRILPGEGGDGLTDDWSGRLAYVNPPFSSLLTWLRRAHDQWKAGRVETVVCLVPVRTDSTWFHDVLSVDADIYLLRGRLRFLAPNGRAQPTPFSLMVVALGASTEQRSRFAELAPGFWIARLPNSRDPDGSRRIDGSSVR